MPEAVFEAGWDADARLPLHRPVVAPAHWGHGREVLSLDWTYAHHERGSKIWGVRKAWDHVEQRLVPYQTVVTVVKRIVSALRDSRWSSSNPIGSERSWRT
jgi:hypothetical protein